MLWESVAGFPTVAREIAADVHDALGVLENREVTADAEGIAAAPNGLRPALTRASRAAHKLAGSAGSMGFVSTGRTAGALEILLESLLDRDAPMSPAARAQIALLDRRLLERVAALDPATSTLFSRPPPPQRVPPPQTARNPGAGPDMRLFGARSGEPWSAVTDRLAAYGWSVEAHPDVPSDHPGAPPDIALIDLDVVPEGLERMADLTGPRGVWAGRPWYGAQAQPTPQARAEAVAAGAVGVLTKPVDADALVDHFATVSATVRDDVTRVAILDPEPALAALLCHVLESANVLAEIVPGPSALLHLLADAGDEGGIDALVMVERTQARGALNLAMALRQDPTWDALGLVVLLPSPSLDPVAGALARGGDVLMPWPVDPDLFAATVVGQAARARSRRLRHHHEGDSPVLVRSALESRIRTLLERATALDLPLTVAWMQGRTPKAAEEAAAQGPEIDRLLARILREILSPTDVLGRGPDGGLAVVLPFQDWASAEARLAPIAERLGRLAPEATLSIGLAERSGPRDQAAPLLAQARANANGNGTPA